MKGNWTIIGSLAGLAVASQPKGIHAHDLFTDEVWPKVLAGKCLKCHKAGGDAEESRFVLQDPAKDGSAGKAVSWGHNRKVFLEISKKRTKDGKSWLVLEKPVEGVEHEGGKILKLGSPRHRMLKDYV